RAVVLRDGVVAGQAAMREIDDQQLVDLIVGPGGGKAIGGTHRRTGTGDPVEPPVRCAVTGMTGGRARDVDLSLRGTEIVGVTGLLGSGAEDLTYLLFGARKCLRGTVRVDDDKPMNLSAMTPYDAVRRHIAMVPADRRRDGIAPSLTVGENTTILVNHRYTSFGRMRTRKLAARVRSLLDTFDVRPRRAGVPIGQLSGGNQQKVVLAKWLEIGPKVLLLHEPTQGVDVAARAEIYRLVRRATEDGTATLWVSSDVEELAAVCDRVLVMADGRIRTELTGDELTEDRISAAVYYHSTDAAVTLAR
ncbi:MAG TPA: ATP-binding cassette domain-containing protein, partial [Pseudonocardiaceae bacterium]|nr:ATP-binding cassette domain-containing protein [Pseudonocardiaceae bacterium]